MNGQNIKRKIFGLGFPRRLYYRTMFILATTIFFVLSFYFLHHGLRVLITKRPFLFSSKNVFWVAALAFLPNIIFPINSFWKHYSFDAETSAPFDWTISFLLLIPLVMYPALLIFYWRILRGYGVLGVTDESFRQALYSVLQELKLPYEERLLKCTSFRLTPISKLT